jgi:hypothetical protein
MNPLHWERQHLVAWGVITILGALVGMLFGWLLSPFSRVQEVDVGTFFIAWLHYPVAYWPWLAFGAIFAALAFYAGNLLTGLH